MTGREISGDIGNETGRNVVIHLGTYDSDCEGAPEESKLDPVSWKRTQ